MTLWRFSLNLAAPAVLSIIVDLEFLQKSTTRRAELGAGRASLGINTHN